MIEQQIILILSDGKFHSGEDIAKQLQLSRTAIWKHISELKNHGIEVYSVKGRGYQIPNGLDLLDHDSVYSLLGACLDKPEQLEVLSSIASTNRYLLSKPLNEKPMVCLAEYQSAGRGRLGRNWYSPFARNLYLSIKMKLPIGIEALSGLSLAVGCAVAQSCDELGVEKIRLKWPNDLRIEGAKVGGVLVELATQAQQGADVVVGLGVNWDMPDSSVIDQKWYNLKPLVNDGITRNTAAAKFIEAIINALGQFCEHGFTSFKACWDKYDECKGEIVTLLFPKKRIHGKCLGVDDSGAILLEHEGKVHRFIGGEISLRKKS